MKAFLKISYVFIISYAIWFGIAGGYISAQSIIPGALHFDIETGNNQEENSLHNTFSFEDEEYHVDTIAGSVCNFFIKTNSQNIIYSYTEFTPVSFLSVIWQPPKLFI